MSERGWRGEGETSQKGRDEKERTRELTCTSPTVDALIWVSDDGDTSRALREESGKEEEKDD